MKSFKFLSKEDSHLLDYNFNQVILTQHRFNPENVEFCFQFDDEEPFVFATGPNECHITLNTTRDGTMSFRNNGRTFKLFARERVNDAHV
jgi:hypothetical protein